MTKSQQVLLVFALLALGAIIFALVQNRAKHQGPIIGLTYEIGQELILNTNSAHLIGLRPGLSAQLSDLLGSPTHVGAVLVGDEAPPVGDGTACSRLILTNQLNHGLELRLAPSLLPEKFQILGYWVTNHHPR